MPKKNLDKWIGVEFQSSSGTTEQFKSFVRDVKAYLKQEFSGKEIIEISKGHFYLSVFIRVGEQFWYFNIGDVRDRNWSNRILFRTAKSAHDYSGGQNQYCKINEVSKIGD